MDEQRDTKKSDSLSKLLASNEVRTNPFGRNLSGGKSYGRAERLVAALCLITAHISEQEPLRKAIRASSIELLSDLLSLRDVMRSANSTRMLAVQVTIRKLVSLVRMLAASGLISIQNADTLAEATDELGHFIQLSERTPFSESIIFTRDELLNGVLPRNKTIKDNQTVAASKTDMPVSFKNERLVTDIDKDRMTSGTAHITRRRSAIIAFLQSVKDAGIRDVASSLPEYSEKMIQRELAALVAAGQVKKTGLKRWSRYSLS